MVLPFKLHWLVVKLPFWPNTLLAASPLESGALNCSARLARASATQALPALSIATASGSPKQD